MVFAHLGVGWKRRVFYGHRRRLGFEAEHVVILLVKDKSWWGCGVC